MRQLLRVKRKKRRRFSPLGRAFRAFTTSTLAVGGGWILYSKLWIDHNVALPQAISAGRVVFNSQQAGQLSYYVDQQNSGRPLVLIHSVNAAASAYEMRPIFEHYRGKRPVYALDLPGYGFSDRAQQEYSPKLFESAILEFLESQVSQPADVVALSLGCEFTALAALAHPERFHSLVLISPSGFNPREKSRAAQQAGKNEVSDLLHPIFSFPLWRRAFFDLITTRWSINYFLEQSFVGPVPPGLAGYAYATSHQPGAEYVPLYFISGKLFTADICSRVYERVQTPALVIYDRDAFVGFDRLPGLLEKNRNWQAKRITPTLGLPHFEQLEQTVNAMDTFWKGLD